MLDRSPGTGVAYDGTPGKLPATAKGAATEEAVYAAAVRLFAQRGYHGTTLRQIASAIDKQMATLYYYFDSKQSLLQIIMRTAMGDLIDGLEHELASVADAGPVERLGAAVRFHVRFHGTRAEEAFVGDSELRAVTDDFRPEIIGMRRRYQSILEGLLEDGAKAKIFAVSDPTIAAFGILQLCTGVATWYRPGGRRTLDEIADIYAHMVVDGLRR